MADQPDDDFAALFEASIKTRRFARGQTIEGTIVAMGPEVAFVNVGGKGEATIALDELKGDEGDVEVAVGDRIQAVVVSTAGGLVLSRRLALGAVTSKQIDDAYRAGLPVEGKVAEVLKGGYEVRIARQRAFCPFSQMDIARVEDPAAHIGRVYAFRILEFKNDGRDLVVSRRALLEEEQATRAVEVRKAIVVGAVMKGRVVSVRDFGAFVDLGAGVQGLVHVSELSWARVSKAEEVVKPGDEVTVKVLRVDEATGQIALGLKQLSADPWTAVDVTYPVGRQVNGRVTRVTDFGAFIELEPGVEALAHMSTFPPTGHSGGWRKTVPVGADVTVEVLTVDLEKKRLGVAVLADSSSSAAAAPAPVAPARTGIVPGARVMGKVDRHESFGIFVFLAPGRVGLMPHSETGADRGVDLKKAFPIGADVEVMVLEADPQGRRIRVSRKAVFAADEAAQVQEYTRREEAAQSQSFGGSLADQLRRAMEKR